MSDAAKFINVALDATPATSRDYAIHIGAGLLARFPALLQQSLPSGVPRAIVISDNNVAESYAEPLVGALDAADVRAKLLTIPAGEPSKSVQAAHELWAEMLAFGCQRDTVVIAVGGGVVGDLAGFVAATFARGLRFVQVPTSLLAQVDSSVGGKVGINLADAKNMVGQFWQPACVLIDIDTLSTLPQRQFTAGLAEVVKYGVIADEPFFAYLEENMASLRQQDHDCLVEVVSRCCQIKADVVAADERETTGMRAILNYGHTVGHALEAVLGYGQLLHGEAIAIGMHCAAKLAMRRGMVDQSFVARQESLLNRCGLPTGMPYVDHDALWQAITHDKKATAEGVRFVLAQELGTVVLVSRVSRQEVLAACE